MGSRADPQAALTNLLTALAKARRPMAIVSCATELARAVYPDVVMCLYTPDELSGGQSGIVDAEFLDEERSAA